MAEIGMAWFAQREDGWEAESERAMTAQGIPCERLDPADGREAVPEPRHGRPRVRALRARGRRGARAARRAGAGAAGGRARRAAGARARARPTATRRSSAASGSRATPSCGRAAPWLGGLFAELVPLKVTCQELLFFDGGPAWRSPGVPGCVDYDLAMYGTGDLDDLGVKVALDDEGPPLDPDAELPAAGATEPAVREYLAAPLPRARGRAAQGGPLLPLRALRGLQLHRRPPPGARAHLDRRRRLGPRLQARPGARRARRRSAARRRAAARALRPRPPRRRALVPHRRLRRLGARRTATNHGPSCTVSPPPSSSASPAAVNQRL